MASPLALLCSWDHKKLKVLHYFSVLYVVILFMVLGIAVLSPLKSLRSPANNFTLQVVPTLPKNFTVQDAAIPLKNSTVQVVRKSPENHTIQAWGSKYRSWKSGLVTRLQPEMARNCKKLFDGYKEEIHNVKDFQHKWENNVTDEDVLNLTSNCSWVKENFNDNLYTTKLELSFPIAFTFVIYNSPQQVMRLLKLLYRPHNQYCISPDKKSGPVFIGIFSNLAKCLDNVHITSTLRDVKWGHQSIMESLMCCYQDLMKIRENQTESDKWKYVINLCGKELPLATNHEIVSHLVKLNGSSMVEAELVPRNDYESLSRLKRKPIPYRFPYAKSSLYMSLSPKFVNYLLTSEKAINLFKYFKHNFIPEEHFFSTVYMIPNIPGGQNVNLLKEDQFIVSRYEWIKRGTNITQTRCHGIDIHHICVVASGDLVWLISNETGSSAPKSLFQNKYFMEKDHVVMDCMEERIVAKNKLEYQTDHMPIL